jgi:hypothetical protein
VSTEVSEFQGRGTGGTSFFAYDGTMFSTTFDVPPEQREPAQDLVRELVEWRLAAYLRRVELNAGADRIVCRVDLVHGRPSLMLPQRDRTAGIPEGWVDITVDRTPYHARFDKNSVTTVQALSDETNVLPDILARWFGSTAGRDGTNHVVDFSRDESGYVLARIKGHAPQGPRIWSTYIRSEVPKLFGFDFKGFESQSGVVERDQLILLFVTLDKSGKPAEQKYDDAFVSANEFRWQSQNRTKRDSDAGRRLAEHAAREISIHLFLRPVARSRGSTQPFMYCGPVTFKRWESDQPITVWWQLSEPVPERHRDFLRVPK